MIGKALDEIETSDLEALIANRVAERGSLEFKRDLPGGSDSAKKEFLADVSSFANAQGGDIIYGLEERQGVAFRLAGLACEDPDALVLRLEAQILTGVEPRLPGVRLQWIDGAGENGGALLIRVPASQIAPHRVIFANSGRFFGRKSNGKYEMDTFELRQAFTASEGATARLRALHLEAVDAARRGALPVSLGDDPKAIVSVLPLNLLRETRDLDIKPEYALAPIKPEGHLERIHMLEGVLLHTNPGVDGAVRSYAITYRRGRTDIVWTFGRIVDELRRSEQRVAWPKRFEEGLLDAVLASGMTLRPFGIDGPWVVFTSLLGIRDYQLMIGHFLSDPAWRDEAHFPELVTDELSRAALLPLLRCFWLCFGVPRPDDPYRV